MAEPAARALDATRDPFSPAFTPGAAYAALLEQLQRNLDTNSMKMGRYSAFHNHAAALLTCVYRLGGSASQIRAVLDTTPELSGLEPARAPPAPALTRATWKAGLGDCGLFGLEAQGSFAGLHAFFAGEVHAHGAGASLARFLPTLAAGAAGDVFHALIELGYHFESRAPALLPAGLAWLAASYVEIDVPDAADAPAPSFADPGAAFAALSADPHAFPRAELADGYSGFIAAVEDAVAHHGAAVLRYELAPLPDDQPAARKQRVRAIVAAGADSFAAGGAHDFYTLHLLTAARAAWAVLEGTELPVKAQDDLLAALWRAMLFTHVARNRPWPPPPARPGRPWEEIVRFGRNSKNSHIAKVVMNCADFWDRWQDDRFWATAEETVAARESGKRLLGVGVGSKMHLYVK